MLHFFGEMYLCKSVFDFGWNLDDPCNFMARHVQLLSVDLQTVHGLETCFRKAFWVKSFIVAELDPRNCTVSWLVARSVCTLTV